MPNDMGPRGTVYRILLRLRHYGPVVCHHPSRTSSGKIGPLDTALFCTAVGPLRLDLLTTKFSSRQSSQEKGACISGQLGHVGVSSFFRSLLHDLVGRLQQQ